VSEGTNRNMPAGNTLVQHLAVYDRLKIIHEVHKTVSDAVITSLTLHSQCE